MKKIIAIIILVLCVLPIIVWSSFRVYKCVIFQIECEGHMKRAADANTLDLAIKEMEIVVRYLEKKGMTKGYTSILYRTPDEDLEFFYKNMKTALEELKSVRANASPLEKSNVLMKLRETLLDEKGSSIEITVPPGISIYPNNVSYAISGVISVILLIIGLIIFPKLFFNDY